jgi:hypothetical protein
LSVWHQQGQTVAGDQFNVDSFHTGTHSPDEFLSFGIRAVRERLYAEARSNLDRAIAMGVGRAEAHYYLALALLEGIKPSRCERDPDLLVRQVEEQLGRAVQIDGDCGHAYALWAAVKRDHYRGMPEPEPSSEWLNSRVGDIDPAHLAEIAPFFDAPGDATWNFIMASAQRGTQERQPTAYKYFMPVPVPSALTGLQVMMALGVAGVFLAIIMVAAAAMDQENALLVCPAVFLGVGGAVLGGKGAAGFFGARSAYAKAVARSEPRPTDAQMDRWLQLDKFALLDSALRNLDRSLDDLICEPQVVVGPASPSQRAVGRDGVQRFSRYKVVVMMLAKRRVSVYSCEWDFLKCIISNADSFDFRYSDITGIRMRQPHDATAGNTLVLTDDVGRQIEVSPSKVFEMIIAGTDRIAVIIDVAPADGGSLQQPSGAAAAEKLIRRQLDLRD